MGRSSIVTLGVVGFILIGLGAPAQAAAQVPDLIIHEWGTFLGMSGWDGTPLDGMYHEEHALPSFVHSRGRDQLRLPFMLLKGETPVIYFYTDRAQPVRLGVGFPKGIWTHWYPQAIKVQPMLEARAAAPERLRGGRICWTAEIIPARQAERGGQPALPVTSEDALWRFSREVDAAYVKVMDGNQDPARPEYERFLFYRGLGESRLPVRMSYADGGTLSLDRDPTIGPGVAHVFVLRVEHGRASFRYLPRIEPGQSLAGVIPDMKYATPMAEFKRAIGTDLAARLVESGLYVKEARAMVRTWENSYFQADGIRALFVLPQSWTDAFIPMNVTPPPKQVVRVMVGRLELLTTERERLAEAAIRELGAPEEARRAQAFATLRAQGRYVEPIVRRVLQTSRDPRVRSLCTRLLTADEITELRSAVHNAADGKFVNEDPLLLRALLARMLRQIGLDSEARSEGVAILNQLERARVSETLGLTDAQGNNVPILDQLKRGLGSAPGPPERAEIRAAALEATALDASAAALYEGCIRKALGHLQGETSPEWIAWCRDWWVGRAYARCHKRAGDLDQTASRLQARLLHLAAADNGPESLLTRVLLAHLREAQGKQSEADALWSRLQPTRGTKVAGRSGC